MASSVTWLDHDAAASERSMRLLDFFNASEARDELGVGGVRDSISDQLFPGTSTIQTRLRYFLFIPWVLSPLDERRLSNATFRSEAAKREYDLQHYLGKNEPDADGVIGRRAGSQLKRLPSSVYWNGLHAWGIRRQNGSMQQYFHEAQERAAFRERRRIHDEGGWEDGSSPAAYWDHTLNTLRPDGFPENAMLALTRDEATYLLEKWQASQPRSLLTWLALATRSHETFPRSGTVWEHVLHPEFPSPIKKLVDHGKRLDMLVRGAAYLYNLQLAELTKHEKGEEYERLLEEWSVDAPPEIFDWDLAEFWPMVLNKGHAITQATRLFLQSWLEIARAERGKVATSPRARELVANRERVLKKDRSRFDNPSVRSQWTGAAGIAPIEFRWPVVQGYLQEWHAAWRLK